MAQPASTPGQRFSPVLTGRAAWLGAAVGRYSFGVGLFHTRLQAGFDPGASLVAAPPSSLLRPQLPDSAPLPDFPFAVIRRALPCGCILAGLSPSPFHRCSFPTCNALRPRGARRPLTPSSSPPVTTFTSSRLGSALPLSTLCSGWPLLEAESHSPLDCSPPGQTRPGVAPGRRDFLLRSFRSMSHLLRTSGMTTAPHWE